MGDHRGRARRRRLPFRRRGRDLDPHQFGQQPAPARLVLHAHSGRPRRPEHRLRAQHPPVPVGGWRHDLRDDSRAARRRARPVDPSGRPRPHGGGGRRGRAGDREQRRDLVDLLQPAHRRTLRRHRRQRLPLSALRGPAGQHHDLGARLVGREHAVPEAALAECRGLRDRSGGPRPRPAPHRLRGVLRRGHGPVRPGVGSAPQHHALPAAPAGDGDEGSAAPLPVGVADGGQPARPERPLPRLAACQPLARRGGDLGDDQPGPHDGQPGPSGTVGRADQCRRDRGGDLQRGLLDRGVALRRERDLGGKRRRAGARDPRRGRQLDRDHAERDAGVGDGGRDRAVGASRGPRVRGRAAVPDRRLRPLHLPHRRLWRVLDPGHQRDPRRSPGAHRAGGSRARRPPLRGDRVRRLRFIRRRRFVAGLPAQPPGHPGYRYARGPRRPDPLHAGALLLDHGRHLAAARNRGGGGGGDLPVRAARCAPTDQPGFARAGRTQPGAGPGGRADSLLPGGGA